jgi:hypothetical protein
MSTLKVPQNNMMTNIMTRVLFLALCFALTAGLIIIPTSQISAAEPPEIEWVRQFGTSGRDWANGVSVDSTGIYVAGYTGVIDRDAFVRKYNASGNVVWISQIGTSASDAANGVYADSTGIYVVGYTQGTLPDQTSAGGYDAFVRKYDASGNEVWTRQFGTTSFDAANGVSVDSTGIYVVGYTQGTFPGQSSAGARDAFLRKYDASGNEVWTRQFGESNADAANGVSVDSTGVYVAGYMEHFVSDQSAAGGDDAFVRKHDTNSNQAWTHHFQAENTHDDAANGIYADSTGIYVVGYSEGTFLDPSSTGGYYGFVRKYNADGNKVWTRQFGGNTLDDAANGVFADSTGIYVTGTTSGTLLDPSNAGDRDAFVRKYDASGNEVWISQFGTSSFDAANEVSVDSTGIYVAGYTQGTFPGQFSAGDDSDHDAFIVKLAQPSPSSNRLPWIVGGVVVAAIALFVVIGWRPWPWRSRA